MSLHIIGPWRIQTPPTNIIQQRSKCSISFNIRINSFGNGFQGKLFGTVPYQVFIGQIYQGFLNTLPLSLGSWSPNYNNLYLNWKFVPGTVYHVAMTWNNSDVSSIYINAIIAQITTSTALSTGSSNQNIELGFFENGNSTIDCELSDMVLYNDYQLIPDDIVALRDKTVDPLTIGNGIITYWNLVGPVGNTALYSDPGFQDLGNSGLNFTSFIDGNPANATYSLPLVYVPPTTISTSITKNGLFTAMALATGSNKRQNIIAVNANPIVMVNGVVVPIWGPIGSPTSKRLPFVMWHLNQSIKATDIITYTAPDNWITSENGVSAGYPSIYVSDNKVINYFGEREPIIGN